jgi:hypothetical protein
MSDAQSQIPPGTPLSITMAAQHWEALLNVLGGGPYRVVSPLIGEIQRQCSAQLMRLQNRGAVAAPAPPEQ